MFASHNDLSPLLDCGRPGQNHKYGKFLVNCNLICVISGLVTHLSSYFYSLL
jgi:hypothetical protein